MTSNYTRTDVTTFDVDDVVIVRVAAYEITAVVLAVSGDLATVQIDMSTYRVPVELCERVAGPDEDYVSTCPACGAAIDYCTGHGDIGDPDGAAVITAHHEYGDHTRCHPAGCEVAADYLARRENLAGKF